MTHTSTGKIWDRDAPLDERIERFTVGRDRELDLRLVAHDALASAAHAIMLQEIGVLSEEEREGLLRELGAVADEARAGRFEIRGDEEDGHTALERCLTEALGDAGKRIHTGRSRNDQVIAAVRLWGREVLLEMEAEVLARAAQLAELAEAHRETSMPGYTHLRQAMPSTLGHHLAAYAEGLLDALPWLDAAWSHINRSPLGSASSYGVALPLDRPRVAELLGFDSVQDNSLAVQNDRGRTEWLVLGAALTPAQDLARLAWDLVLWSGESHGFVRLPESVTTGSSIMPQKRNPDVLELVRGSAARLRARHAEIAQVFAALPTGYHRDLQLTKEPFLEGMQLAVDAVAVMEPVLAGLEVDADRCRGALDRAIGATDEVYRRIARGKPFRDAYREVAADPEGAVAGDPAEGWRDRTHLGAPGALDLGEVRRRIADARPRIEARRGAVQDAWNILSLT
jgi:argininosuccinate lyase